MNKKLEEFNSYLKNKKVAIIGLGVSNLPLLKYMNKKEAIVTVFDKRNSRRRKKRGNSNIRNRDANEIMPRHSNWCYWK